MDNEPGCIFCDIVAGKLPSTTIAQTERAIAFMDINPVTPGHALVIPRSHATDIFDITAEDLAASAELAQRIGRRVKDRLGADGVNLLNCSGEAAWQTVFHVATSSCVGTAIDNAHAESRLRACGNTVRFNTVRSRARPAAIRSEQHTRNAATPSTRRVIRLIN